MIRWLLPLFIALLANVEDDLGPRDQLFGGASIETDG